MKRVVLLSVVLAVLGASEAAGAGVERGVQITRPTVTTKQARGVLHQKVPEARIGGCVSVSSRRVLCRLRVLIEGDSSYEDVETGEVFPGPPETIWIAYYATIWPRIIQLSFAD